MANPEGGRPPLQLRSFSLQSEGSPIGFPDRRPPGTKSRSFEKASITPGGTIVSFANNERKVGGPDIFSKEWVQREVARERQTPIPSGGTPWYHLPGTGFWVKEQIAQLMRNGARTGDEEKVNLEFKKVEKDTEAFVDEYLEQMVNLRWNLGIGEVDGGKRILCSDYGNVTLESVTSKKERDGVVHKTLFGNKEKGIVGVEEQIIIAPAGTMAIIVSPEGWSGLQYADGSSIRYPESQTYVIKKLADGKLQAYTFRSKMSISQNEDFQRSLGLSISIEENQFMRIKNTFSNYAIITPRDADWAELEGRIAVRDFEDVVDLMQQSVGGREEAYEGKTFADMRAFLRNPELFDKRHPLTEKFIQRFEDYGRWRLIQGGLDKDIETDLQIALAFNPTQLGKLYREEGVFTIVDTGDGMREVLAKQRLDRLTQIPGGMNYQRELRHLQELPGCAGGGTSSSFLSIGGSRKGEKEWFTCPKCHFKANGPIGNSCPGCGITKQMYAETGGEVC